MARRFFHSKDDWYMGWTRIFSTVDLPRTRYDNWESLRKINDFMSEKCQRVSFRIDFNDLKLFNFPDVKFILCRHLAITEISYPTVEKLVPCQIAILFEI